MMREFLANVLRRMKRAGDEPSDVLAWLIMAAQDDAEFRAGLVAVLQLPIEQRKPLLLTATEQMRLRGESPAAIQAFATLATAEGARVALQLLAES